MSLPVPLTAIIFTLLVWWFSTGVILYLDGLPKHTYRWSLAAAGIVAIAALYGLCAVSDEPSSNAAYCSFTCAILLWGWLEMAFLMGLLTGSRSTPCPPAASESQRFVFATQSILHHELSLIIATMVLLALTWHDVNQIGTWTFLILWVMRLSAKLNLFLGVRNRYENFLPDHLSHLKSYFAAKTMNLLFPVSVMGGSLLAALLWHLALSNAASPFEEAGCSLLATLLTLAVIEHWFLVLPLPVEALWNWAMGSRSSARKTTHIAPTELPSRLIANKVK